MNLEKQRLSEPSSWRTWGPYLSERQWGTVREDYSTDGSAWNYMSFEQSQYRAPDRSGVGDVFACLCADGA